VKQNTSGPSTNAGHGRALASFHIKQTAEGWQPLRETLSHYPGLAIAALGDRATDHKSVADPSRFYNTFS